MKNIALIVAGGTGSRMKNNIPKQFLKLGQKTVLEYSIEAFLNHPEIDNVKIVINKDYKQEAIELTSKYNILPHSIGGATRQESVYNGLSDLKSQSPKNVLIHDAARPFVSNKIISDSIEALKTHEVSDVVLPITDTIKTRNNTPLNRDEMLLVQTPQGFDFDTICKLHEENKGEALSDDISLAHNAGLDIKKVQGEKINFKITTDDDLVMANALISKTTRVGYGYDIHEFDYSGNKTSLPICGVEIDCGFSVTAHSDGDVGLHALVDAILGAAGKGDIGILFPPSDAKWKDANSEIFINKCN